VYGNEQTDALRLLKTPLFGARRSLSPPPQEPT